MKDCKDEAEKLRKREETIKWLESNNKIRIRDNRVVDNKVSIDDILRMLK